MSLDIHIKSVPHWTQRYDTLGDWIYEQDGHLYIRVSDLGDWRMEFAIAIHELVESALCRVAGITQQHVDNFDFVSDAEEPGDDPAAPYHKQHVFATKVEYSVIGALGVSLEEYEERCRKPVSISSPNKATAPDSLSG